MRIYPFYSFAEKKSYYDPATKTFHFLVVYYVSAGAFGGDDEIESGKYAGESGIGMGLIKVTPITNQILRVKNFTSEELNP